MMHWRFLTPPGPLDIQRDDEDWCGDLDHAERFELKLVMELIRKYKVTVVPVAHPVVLAFAKSPETERYDLSSVRIIISNAVIGQTEKKL
ncbi:hypothetical protein YC2023_067031 [Brassica napus]